MQEQVLIKRRLFGTSGVRGIVGKELTVTLLIDLGMAIATSLPARSWIIIANDTRNSRIEVKAALKKGLIDAGARVLDAGTIPTPALAYLTKNMGVATGIMVTASHNPAEYNGVKLFSPEGIGYSYEQEQNIERIFYKHKFRYDEGSAQTAFDLQNHYFDYLKQTFGANSLSNKFKVIVDPGNGAASNFATILFLNLGLNVIPVNDTVDGSFPGRAPEPRPDTLIGTYELLRKEHADLAVCFDGDADRVVFLDERGFIGFDESITFLASLAIKSSHKKTVATTVEAGSLLDLGLKNQGATIIRGTVGDMPVSYLTRSSNAAIGVEPVGVYIMPESGFYPNSFLAALTLMKNIEHVGEIRSFFKDIPKLYKQQIKIPCSNEKKAALMRQVIENSKLFGNGIPLTIDGLRLESYDSWILIRPSGTEPIIRVVAESQDINKTEELLADANSVVTGFLRE
jgi:phosphoglucosamine mutase